MWNIKALLLAPTNQKLWLMFKFLHTGGQTQTDEESLL
jgi:hypothetical protein